MNKSRSWLLALVPALLMPVAGCKVEPQGTDTAGDTGQGEQGAAVAVPDTGQTSCYYDVTDPSYVPSETTCAPDSGWGPHGQDGEYRINTMSFTDNGDGTVLDNVTGLTWQKCSMGRSGSDCAIGAFAAYTWAMARQQCAYLNLAGTGWRLPTIHELTQLVDYGRSSAAIDESFFPGTALAAYWSATPNAMDSSYVWDVNFSQGTTFFDNQTAEHYVRCVRD